MEDLIYKNICEKLGYDLKKDPMPVRAYEYDGPDEFSILTDEELDHLLYLNLDPKIKEIYD